MHSPNPTPHDDGPPPNNNPPPKKNHRKQEEREESEGEAEMNKPGQVAKDAAKETEVCRCGF